MRQRLRSLLLAATVVAALGGGWGAGALRPATAQTGATPPPYGAGIGSTVYANVTPVAVEDPSLALALVTVAPGAAIALHHHPATQIGTIAGGELTYSVASDRVELRRAGTAPDAAPEYIEAGETARLRPGDTVVEPPTSWHHAVNAGEEPVEIWVATLFPAGAPRTDYATPSATPAP